MARLFGVLFLLILWKSCDSAYFEDQPKFLTENGNFVIESAVDRNISFRLKGSSFLNVNGFNVMTMLGGTGQPNARNTDIALRIGQLEEQIRRLSLTNGGGMRPLNRNIINRVQALESRVNAPNFGRNNTGLFRRVRILETRVNQLIDRLNADNCSSNPCQNGGVCTNTFMGYTCKCTDAWTGTNCNEDVNECAIYAGTDLGCQNSISCENIPGGYNCRCKPGWQGIHCTKRNVNCFESSAYELCGHGICVQTNDHTSYGCICNQGWTSNGTSPACTVDVNECQSPTPHCSMDPEVSCINLPGSFTCGQCPHGFTGNGHYCKDLDECETNNGGCSLAPFVPCLNTRGSSKCGPCPFGYSGDGRVCIRTIPTPNLPPYRQRQCDNPGFCHPLATCVQNLFGATCICPPHHVGNGIGPLGCVRSNSTYDGCTQNPCQNGGTCTPIGSFAYRCNCPAGFGGPTCIRRTALCSPNPCQNGGTCVPLSQVAYRCDCIEGRFGRNCQLVQRACGGILLSMNGTLKYPLENTYPHNARCAWLIKTRPEKVLNITFTKFNLEQSQECRYDWLQIHDGRSSANFMIGRFCGSQLPKNGNIVSTQNMLYLWFRSDNSSTNDGFELKWNSIDPVCGGEIFVESYGTIASPGSPGNYPANRDCIWQLSAPPGKRIQLHFFTMQLESHETCQFDYLAIYSGLSTDGDLLEKFCNTTHPEPLISPTNELTLKFHSDEDQNDAGFQIHYSLLEGIQGCGGTFTAKSGEFGSPIQNGAYPKNIECHYLIRMPRKNETRVKLTFLTFKLEDSNSCNFDYVEIYEGHNMNAPKVGRWCGSRIPPEYSSLSSEILIVFHTDFSFSDDGFRLKYETLCGGKYQDDNGVITSPWFPNPYEDDKHCLYDIEAPLGKAIVLNFTDFSIEDDCDFDSLSIYDGIDSNSTLIGTYCGSQKPPAAISTLNHLHLEFKTDSSNTGPGFRADYSFIDAGCGGIVKRANLTISPPWNSNGYASRSNCKWIIVAPVGYIIELRFTTFDLEPNAGCRYDYLAIYDNIVSSEANKEPIGKYCGTDKPPTILSTSRALSIFFKSDESVNGQGFLATYDFIDGRNLCGGKFYSLTGTITSPNFPNRYAANQDCIFVINAPNGKQIQLNVEAFDLEDSSSCSFDSLEIRNGRTESSPLIGTYCGTTILPRFKSFSNHLYLRFRTDSSNENKGFKMSYDTAISGCGGTFANAQSGTIASPNYPEAYMANMQCDYIIQVARGSTVNLHITDLDMEITADCSFDYVSIYDGPNSASKLVGTYCHIDQVTQIESTSNSLFIRMVSDVNNQGHGFEMKFRANCKREIHDLRGAIESPNFPSQYPNYAKCEWKLVPPMGNRIYLEFSHFDLEHSWSSDSGCTFDFLIIEQRTSNDALVRSDKYCRDLPKPVNTSHTVIIKFETDYSTAGDGFHLEYEIQGCGGVLNKPEGTFTSPNYPNEYPLDTHCQWIIEVDYGHLIEITFTDFDFEASPGCGQDGLIIANDANATHIITKFCGSKHDQNQVVTSIGNKVYVNFFSDLSYNGRGFSASYKAINSKCGGVFTTSQGRITSLNYPNNYAPSTSCQWLLRTETSHTIEFKFTDFDLEDQNCTADFVSIYDGSERRNDKLLLKTCGSQTIGSDATNQTKLAFTKPLRSSGNEMLVIMETDDNIEAKGFDAGFATACGSKINTSSYGMIEIGNNIRWVTDDCEWTITANDPSQHVSLSIMHLDNEPVFEKYVARLTNQTSKECFRKIYVYDGTSKQAPKIAEICSNKHPPAILSEGHALTIAFEEIEDKDFAFTFDLKAYYTVLDNDCGGLFQSVYGQIASPGYPRTYKNNIECEWTIKASPGNQMELSIDMMDIAETDFCNGDYLEVRENNSSGRLFGAFCGNKIPPAIPNADGYWLKFRSDNDGVGRGFRLEYNYAKLVEQTGSSGVITSVMYPNYVYYTIGSYKYRITVKPGNLIRLSIDNCIMKRDSQVAIFDGFDHESGPLALIQTGDIPTEPILSSQNVIMLEFSISTFSETKFKFIWSEVPKSAIDSENITSYTLNCTKNSVVFLSEFDSVNLRSPGYPNGYDANLECQWTFLPNTMGYHVSAAFSTVDLETTPDCISDYVLVGSGNDMQNFQVHPRICNMRQSIRANRYHGSPNLRIKFITDFTVNRTGFDSTIMLDCGGVMEGTQGQITHEMTVSNRSQYWMNDTCTWTVSVKRGRTIKFNFEKLRLSQNNDGSCNNYILIRNGMHDDSPFLGMGKYCRGTPFIPITSGNKAIVQFTRTRTFRATNEFILNYQQVEFECGGTLTLDHSRNTTVISSPNYPNIPSPHIECIWRLTAPNGELMKIEFLDRFDLTQSPTCASEYLEIREGSTSTAPLIGKYCGTKPQPIFSATNMIRLLYFTDIPVPKNGFKLKVSFARCGKSIIANSGFISSPGFPGKGAYPTQTTCDYHITGRMGTVMNITFLSLDLPEANNCSEVDHVVILSMVRGAIGNNTYIEIAKICGNAIPDSILTYSSNALIRFVSKSANSLYSGFRLQFQSKVDVCGSRIEASSGVIQSPGYPESQDVTRYCEWLITVPKGRRVKVEILDFDIKPAQILVLSSMTLVPSSGNRLSFYNDFYFVSHIQTITGAQTTPPAIYSSDNKMAIAAFIQRSNVGHRGFKVRFTSNEATICEGNLNGNSGNIQAPSNASQYYCEFVRDNHQPFFESNRTLGTLAIKIIEEPRNTTCIPNLPTGISVTFLNNEKRTFFTKCPSTFDNIASPYLDTKLAFRSRPSIKYRFTYKTHRCGGILTNTMTNKISSPIFEQNYGEVDCAWQFTSNTDRNIQMIINARSMNCETEYLNYYRGKASNRPRMGRICASQPIINQTITITGQSVFIEYHSNNYNPSSHFDIELITSDGFCGGTLLAPNYIFSSPMNGTKYPANTECEWIIRAQNGYHVGLQFIRHFMIESSSNCTKDYISVSVKNGDQFNETGRYCGRDFPPILNSTSREMKVKFHSDDAIDGDGFVASWAENCGGIFRATNQRQVITSPRYPDHYPKNIFCNYSIIADEGQSVTVKFLDFDLEATNNLCVFDNVTIYRGTPYVINSPVEEVGSYCKKNSLTTFRFTQRIDVVFRTDTFIERTGFKFEYGTDGCGGNITESTKISSLHDDSGEGYLPLATCIWFITAPSDKKIIVRFEYFDLETNPGCYLDYVEVYDGHSIVDNKRKARICGNLTEHAPSISIDSNKGLVKFATDATINAIGFSALILFTKNCNEHINLTSSQPNHVLDRLSGQYEPLLNCEVFITAPKGYVIQAKFSQFHLAPCETVNNSCTCDYLNIRDGGGPFAESIGSFCGHTNPPDILTTSGDLYMRFVTDSVGFSTGFRVELQIVRSPCGLTAYHLNNSLTSVTITSPMNGNHYQPNMNCIWQISADNDKLIEIKFEQFDVQSSPDNKCSLDFLEISDEESKTYISEGLGENTVFSGSSKSKNQYFYWGKQWPTASHRYCGNTLPIDYLSSYKTIFVHFKSDQDVEQTGFKFTASIISDCARNYTQLQGRLFSKSIADCESYISVPENFTISLYFTSMDFRLVGQCTDDNKPLKVYDGKTNELLQSYCGESVPSPLFTTTNLLRLKFKNVTIQFVASDLYDITYVATNKSRGCGGELYNYGGTFTSPGYPNPDRNNSDCTWTINVPINLVVALQFSVFDMGLRSTCEQNYVELIETDENLPSTKFCGSDNPAPYKSKTNKLNVRFKSGRNLGGTGWIANFMAVHENSVVNNF